MPPKAFRRIVKPQKKSSREVLSKIAQEFSKIYNFILFDLEKHQNNLELVLNDVFNVAKFVESNMNFDDLSFLVDKFLTINEAKLNVDRFDYSSYCDSLFDEYLFLFEEKYCAINTNYERVVEKLGARAVEQSAGAVAKDLCVPPSPSSRSPRPMSPSRLAKKNLNARSTEV